ncbi:MAG: carboxypeptidase-like regulatory domain-containing protein, partial [Bacteroidales bacterium]|nr:carboxypeptidase-like regulatory domain-containing protein [Bacteroidales bacterium]
MKKYFVGVLFLLMSVSLYAQNASVRGFVYDKTTGEPVIFANVVIENTTIGAATDVNGYFVISKLKEGSYNLKIGTIGYETATYPIKLEKGKVSSV